MCTLITSTLVGKGLMCGLKLKNRTVLYNVLVQERVLLVTWTLFEPYNPPSTVSDKVNVPRANSTLCTLCKSHSGLDIIVILSGVAAHIIWWEQLLHNKCCSLKAHNTNKTVVHLSSQTVSLGMLSSCHGCGNLLQPEDLLLNLHHTSLISSWRHGHGRKHRCHVTLQQCQTRSLSIQFSAQMIQGIHQCSYKHLQRVDEKLNK